MKTAGAGPASFWVYEWFQSLRAWPSARHTTSWYSAACSACSLLLHLMDGVILDLSGNHACICCLWQSYRLLLTHVGLVDVLLE